MNSSTYESYGKAIIDFQQIIYCKTKVLGYIPNENSELYVCKIPKDATVEELFIFFNKSDSIFQIRLMMCEDKIINRGFAYVQYHNKEFAKAALEGLTNAEFRPDMNLKITYSFNNNRIFLGGIPTDKSKDDVWKELVNYKISGIIDVIMYRAYNERDQNRGFVFVEFITHEKAASFKAKFGKHFVLFNNFVIVDWSVPQYKASGNTMEKITRLYLRNLDVTESSEDLKTVLTRYISAERIEKVYKFKNYAFIHFFTRGEAELMLTLLQAHYRNSFVEVTWANPNNKFTKPEYRGSKVTRNIKAAQKLYLPMASTSTSSESSFEKVYPQNRIRASNSISTSFTNSATEDECFQQFLSTSFTDLPPGRKLSPIGSERSSQRSSYTNSPIKDECFQQFLSTSFTDLPPGRKLSPIGSERSSRRSSPQDFPTGIHQTFLTEARVTEQQYPTFQINSLPISTTDIESNRKDRHSEDILNQIAIEEDNHVKLINFIMDELLIDD